MATIPKYGQGQSLTALLLLYAERQTAFNPDEIYIVWWPLSALRCGTYSEHSRIPTWGGHSGAESGRSSA